MDGACHAVGGAFHTDRDDFAELDRLDTSLARRREIVCDDHAAFVGLLRLEHLPLRDQNDLTTTAMTDTDIAQVIATVRSPAR